MLDKPPIICYNSRCFTLKIWSDYMALCQYCGKEIPDGSVCDCAESQLAATNTETPDVAPAKKKNIKPVLIAILFVILIIAIAVVRFATSSGSNSGSATGGYQDPINDFITAMNNSDGELLLGSMLPESMLTDLSDDDIQSVDDALGYIITYEYGEDAEFSVEFGSKETLDSDTLDSIAELYTSYFDATVEITEGYAVNVDMTVTVAGEPDVQNVTINVVNVDGTDWKISPDTFSDIG
jgi:hypothetical protein